MSPRAAFLACLALWVASPVWAATLTVLPDGTGDYPRIQDAIDAAVSGDEIVLGHGTFVGPRNRDLSFLGKNLTLRSQSGNPALCTIDCEGQSRGLSITQGETAAVVQGITILNGFAPRTTGTPASPGWGGGVNLSGVTAAIRFCVISQCSADDGPGAALAAGVFASHSTVDFVGCAFVDNFFATRGTGAGLFAWNGSDVTATQCSFLGNRAPGVSSGGSGGGIRVQESRLTLVRCEVVGNMADTGAGISCGQLCIVDFDDVLVAGNSNNTAQGSLQGAGIQFGYDTDGSVRSCSIIGNRAYGQGAGISVANDCNLAFEKTVIWGNCIGAGQGESAYLQADGAVDFTCCDVDPAKVTGGTTTYTSSLVADPVFCNAPPCASAPTRQGTDTLEGSSPLWEGGGCGLIGSSNVICDILDVPTQPDAATNLRIRCGPNPFRDAAMLRYAIPRAGRVDVQIFDAAGRLVRRFDEGTREAGAHAIQWDGRSHEGSRVPPGAYYVRIGTREAVATDWVVRVE